MLSSNVSRKFAMIPHLHRNGLAVVFSPHGNATDGRTVVIANIEISHESLVESLKSAIDAFDLSRLNLHIFLRAGFAFHFRALPAPHIARHFVRRSSEASAVLRVLFRTIHVQRAFQWLLAIGFSGLSFLNPAGIFHRYSRRRPLVSQARGHKPRLGSMLPKSWCQSSGYI